jgi:hypothetical protein
LFCGTGVKTQGLHLELLCPVHQPFYVMGLAKYLPGARFESQSSDLCPLSS